MSLTALEAAAAAIAATVAGGPTLNTSASYTNYDGSITMPAGINTGDVIIVLQTVYRTGTTPSAAYGTGFTAIDSRGNYWVSNDNSYSRRSTASMKIANGTEGGTTVGGFQNNNAESAVVLVYTPSSPATTLTKLDVENRAQHTDPASITINAGTSSKECIAFGLLSASGSTISTSWDNTSEVEYDDIGAANGARLSTRATAFAAGSGTDVVVDMNDAGNMNIVLSGYIEIN